MSIWFVACMSITTTTTTTKNAHQFDTRTEYPRSLWKVKWSEVTSDMNLKSINRIYFVCLFICMISVLFLPFYCWKKTQTYTNRERPKRSVLKASKIDLSLCSIHMHRTKLTNRTWFGPPFSYRITNCYLAMKLTVHFSVSVLLLLLLVEYWIQHHNKLNIIAFDTQPKRIKFYTYFLFFISKFIFI